MTRSYSEYLSRKQALLGAQFDTSELDPRFIRYYETQERIKVRVGNGIYYGTVGITTGWRPVFLLMFSVRSHGSWFTLTYTSELLAVKRNGQYQRVR